SSELETTTFAPLSLRLTAITPVKQPDSIACDTEFMASAVFSCRLDAGGWLRLWVDWRAALCSIVGVVGMLWRSEDYTRVRTACSVGAWAYHRRDGGF